MNTNTAPEKAAYKKPFKVWVVNYRIILKAARPHYAYCFNLVSSVSLTTTGEQGTPTKCALFFRRANDIQDPQYDTLNDRVTIDFAIEETSAVIQLLQSHKKICLEMKIQDERVYVDLYPVESSLAGQGSDGNAN